MIPFTTEETVSAHQIPFNPMPAQVRSIARGILAPVRITLMRLHSLVRPSPDRAPMVISSTDIKVSLNPIIIR